MNSIIKKAYKIVTDKGIYYNVVSDKGCIGTNKNGKKWHQLNNNVIPEHATEINISDLPKVLQKDLENFNI